MRQSLPVEVVRDVCEGATRCCNNCSMNWFNVGPNYFGPQRQGRSGDELSVGRRTAPGSGTAQQDAARQTHLVYECLSVARVQSDRRQTDPSIDQVWLGDWAMKTDNGACFPVEQPEVRTATRRSLRNQSDRAALWLPRAVGSRGSPATLSGRDRRYGNHPELLSQAGAECRFRGERRALRVRLNDLEWSLDGSVLTLSFWLPRGPTPPASCESGQTES